MNDIFNQVNLIGNVGKEIELKQVNDKVVVNFNLATNEYYTNKDGEKLKETDWHSCTAWNGLAESIAKNLSKGSKVAIKGKLKNNNYTNSKGEDVYGYKVEVSSFLLLDGYKEEPI